MVLMQVPARFGYEVAGSVGEAIELLERHGEDAYLLAGGHSLIPMMKLRLASPEVVIDIHKLDDELRYVREDDGSLRIGALARHREVLESPIVNERYTILADAEKMIADPLVRNMGTLGGALAHADPAEDLPAAFVALGGEVVARGPGGERTVHIDDLYVGPYETVLEHGEMLTEVRVPRAPGGSAYTKIERRAGDWTSASVGVALDLRNGEIAEIRIGMAGVGNKTLRALGAEEALRGRRPGDEAYKRAGEAAAEESDPIEDARGTAVYKRGLLKVIVGRTVAKAVERAGGRFVDRERLMRIDVNVNGGRIVAEVEPRLLLLHFIRETLGLTGTHWGCDTSNCGACTVLLDGEAVKSCTVLAVRADGHDVTTIEGISAGADLTPLQEGFRVEHGLQCGFCTPGMILTSTAYLEKNPDPSEHEIREAISGNLCRCTGYENIIKAVRYAAEKNKEGVSA